MKDTRAALMKLAIFHVHIGKAKISVGHQDIVELTERGFDLRYMVKGHTAHYQVMPACQGIPFVNVIKYRVHVGRILLQDLASRASSIPRELSTPVIERTNGCSYVDSSPVPQPKSRTSMSGVNATCVDIASTMSSTNFIR